MTRGPTIVVCLFDQKSNGSGRSDSAKLKEMKQVSYTASDIVRYCARLKLLPSPNAPAVDLPWYITRGGEVGAVAFRNFELDDLAGMTRELERDALMASSSLGRPWIHGCISIDVSPTDYVGEPDDLLDLGDALMKMFGVDENRYMLAAHLDSGKIHLHFLYSRVDTEGNLRERDRKMPKFMAEEATALLAHEHGFSLEPRHLSRVTQEGILDLASGRIVRDLDFGEDRSGMKSRNAGRKKTKGNELLTLALVARHEARDLGEFRTMLAPYGITYEKNGSGAEFFDMKGDRHKVSDVDQMRRFTPNNMFDGTLLTCFPETSESVRREAERVRVDARLARDILTHPSAADDRHAGINLAQDTRNYANSASDVEPLADTASTTSVGQPDRLRREPNEGYNDQNEIDRFFGDRGALPANPTYAEIRWENAAVTSLKSRPGRPAKGPIVPGWPARIRFAGCLGASAGGAARVTFSDKYEMLERAGQTEVWREGELIASIRASRMAIVSTKEEDFREALRAAHRAWGSVEVFGKPKFKKQMAKLAAEMDIPLSNPELKDGIARMKKARPSATRTAVTGQSSTPEQRASPLLGAAAPSPPNHVVVAQTVGNSVSGTPIAPAARPMSARLSAAMPPTASDPMMTVRAIEVKNGQKPAADKRKVPMGVELSDETQSRLLAIAAKLIVNQQDKIAPGTQVILPVVRPIGPDVAISKSAPAAPTNMTRTSAPTPPSTSGSPTPERMANTTKRGKLIDEPSSPPVRIEMFSSIIHGNWPIRRDPYSPSQMTLYDKEIRAFRIHPGDLEGPEMQGRLAKLYQQQRGELASLSAAVRNGTIRVVTRADWKGGVSVSLRVPPGSPLGEIHQRCANHPDFTFLMDESHGQFIADQETALRIRVAAEAKALKEATEAAGVASEKSNCQDPKSQQPNVPLAADSIGDSTKPDGFTPTGESETDVRPSQKVGLNDRPYAAKPPATVPDNEHDPALSDPTAQMSGGTAFSKPVSLTKEERAELLRPRSLPYTPSPADQVQGKSASSTRSDVDDSKFAPAQDRAETTEPLEGQKPAGRQRVDPGVASMKARGARRSVEPN